jgi:hypothetical protein
MQDGSDMQLLFFEQQFFNGLLVEIVRNTTVNRTYSGALGFLMKSLTFCTLVWSDIVGIVAQRSILVVY